MRKKDKLKEETAENTPRSPRIGFTIVNAFGEPMPVPRPSKRIIVAPIVQASITEIPTVTVPRDDDEEDWE